MLRKNYDSELAELNENVTRMGKLSEEAILSALKAVKGEDDNAKEHVDALAVEFDSKKREVENTCIRLILTQQPVASDLRFISAALKFATDLHRIGISSADIVDCVSGRKELRSRTSSLRQTRLPRWSRQHQGLCRAQCRPCEKRNCAR